MRSSEGAALEVLRLPIGMSAWALDGRPVRRVATRTREHVVADPSGLAVVEAAAVALDVAVFGDGWVDLQGRRVSPPEVLVLADGVALP